MARKPRIHVPGALYHVMLQGESGKKIFSTDADRKYLESLVAEGVQRFGHKVHAYCFLPDRLHLAIQVDKISLSKIMQNLSFRYTRYYNNACNSQGQLFHGRYKAILIDAKTYLVELVRYIHHAPARTGASRRSDSFKWSSHKAYLGKAKSDWLTRADVYDTFAKREPTAIKRYEDFFAKGAGVGTRSDLERGNDGAVLGDKSFQRQVRKAPAKKPKPVSFDKLVKHVLKEEGVKEAALANPSRARAESLVRQIISYLAIELESASLTDVANRFGRDLTTMSRNLRNFRDRLVHDKALAKKVAGYQRALVK